MKSLTELRKITGLSQQQLADCLGVSRSLLSMAEKHLRDLPSDAVIKLGELVKLMEGSEQKPPPVTATPEINATKKIALRHEKKAEHHEFKAMTLQRRMAAALDLMKRSEAQAELLDRLLTNKGQLEKYQPDVQWLKYQAQLSEKSSAKNISLLQKLDIDLEIELAYAAAHRKVFERLNGSLN